MKLSPLDIKKKKIIQNIRTLLNDYPSTHPLANDLFINASYRVLYDLHLNMLAIDGLDHKRNHGKAKQSLPISTPRSGGMTVNFDEEVHKDKLESVTQAIERAQRLSNKRKTIQEEEKSKEDKKKRKSWRNRPKREEDPLLALAMGLEIL